MEWPLMSISLIFIIFQNMTRRILLILRILLIASILPAQRYTKEIFSEVQVTEDVVYGENATFLYQLIMGEAIREDLLCDIYEPLDDVIDERPLVLVFHSGDFLPPVINGQIIGTRKDSAVVEICSQLARRGFVAAAVSYRLGWNPLSATQPERATGFIRALYRDIQDGRSVIRYFKKTEAEDNNPFKIDVNKIACWGIGTGAHIVLGMVGLDNYEELLNTSHSPGLFLDIDMDGISETPMIDTLYLGDPEGKTLAIAADSLYGFVEGDTLCYPNHSEYSSAFQIGVNIGGGVVDTTWLDDQLIPIISVQSINDIFTPYNKASLIVANSDPVLNMCGAQQIGRQQETHGLNELWKDYNFSDPTTQLTIENSVKAGHPYYEGTFPYVQDPNSNGYDEGVVMDWWDPEVSEPTYGMGVAWDALQSPSGVSYHEQGLILNEGMSAAKAKANIDTIMQYVLPRLTLQLGLLEIVNVKKQVAREPAIYLSPNPANSFVVVHSDEAIIEAIEIVDRNGRSVLRTIGVEATPCRIERLGLGPGVYFVKVQVDGFVLCSKMVFL